MRINNYLSIIVLIFAIISIFQKDKKRIILFSIFSNIIIVVIYILSQRYLGCFLVVGILVRAIIVEIFAYLKRKPNIFVLLFFEIYFIVISIILWQDYYDLFMLANALILTFATWQDNITVLRSSTLVTSILKFVYNLLIGVYFVAISEAIKIFANIISIVKYEIMTRVCKGK